MQVRISLAVGSVRLRAPGIKEFDNGMAVAAFELHGLGHLDLEPQTLLAGLRSRRPRCAERVLRATWWPESANWSALRNF